MGVAWSPTLSRFCAIGYNGPDGFCVTTSDGTNYAAQTIPAGVYKGICWDPAAGKYIAVGYGICATSSTGLTGSWATKPIPGGSYHDYRAVATDGNGRILALGYKVDSACAVSTDGGETWTQQAASGSATDAYAAICWAQDRFVAVGSAGLVATSPTGLTGTWTKATVPVGLTGAAFGGVAFGNGRLVATGYGAGAAACITSDDLGATWVQQTIPSPTGAGYFNPLVWTGAIFVALDSDVSGGATGACVTTTDGASWTLQTLAMPFSSYRALVWSGNMLLGVGDAAGSITTQAVTSMVVP
jgi:hypothetical protein